MSLQAVAKSACANTSTDGRFPRRLSAFAAAASLLGGCSLLFSPADSNVIADPDLVAEYRFDGVETFDGYNWVLDDSGHTPPMDLQVDPNGDVPGFGSRNGSTFIRLPSGNNIGLATPEFPLRIATRCAETNAFTVAAWLEPQDLFQRGPARIVDMGSTPSGASAFTLGQLNADFIVRLSTPSSEQYEASNSFDERSEPQFIALSYDGSTVKLWKEGLIVEEFERQGTLDDWLNLENVRLAVGELPDGQRHWEGALHHLSIYCADMSDRLPDIDAQGPP